MGSAPILLMFYSAVTLFACETLENTLYWTKYILFVVINS